MILEDVLAVDGLAVTRDGVHAVQVHARADDRERVAGEVQVGHRVDEQVALGLGVYQRVEGNGAHERKLDLGLGDAGHRLLDELEIVGDGVQLLTDGGRGDPALDAGLGEPLIEELLAGLRNGVERLGYELLEIQDLDALLAQDLGEAIVLLLSHLEEGNVVEQKTLELVRRQIEELLARAMQANLLQLPNLARDMQSFRHSLLPFYRGPNRPAFSRRLSCLGADH